MSAGHDQREAASSGQEARLPLAVRAEVVQARSHHQFSGVPYHHLVGKAFDAARLGAEFAEELAEDRVV